MDGEITAWNTKPDAGYEKWLTVAAGRSAELLEVYLTADHERAEDTACD
jgi:hypothetical protein